jgi:ATP-dependent Clp protease ATP-binding subunit ClpA
LEINEVIERLKDQKISLELDPAAKEFLIERGFDPVFGARPLKRTIQRFLEDPLAKDIISGKFKAGSTVKVSSKNTELVFQ